MNEAERIFRFFKNFKRRKASPWKEKTCKTNNVEFHTARTAPALNIYLSRRNLGVLRRIVLGTTTCVLLGQYHMVPQKGDFLINHSSDLRLGLVICDVCSDLSSTQWKKRLAMLWLHDIVVALKAHFALRQWQIGRPKFCANSNR